MKTRSLRSMTALLLTALLVTVAASPALAADKSNKKDKKAQEAAAALAAAADVETLKGTKFRMASTAMAPRVTRIADAMNDQITNTGQSAVQPPEHTDLVQVYVASTRMPRKLLTKQAKDFPEGTAGSFYGGDAAWESGSPAIFVAAKMAARRPRDAGGQQLQIGIDGDAATPVQAGSVRDSLLGLERFSLNGIFNNGVWSSGSTDVSGRFPGDPIDWYNAPSGVFGYYDAKRSTYYAIVPRPRDAQFVTVSVRSSSSEGEIVDRLEQPGGGRFIDLGDAAGGFDVTSGSALLTCMALETFSAESSDPTPSYPDGNLIRYTVGAAVGTEPDTASALLAPALDAVGPMPVLLSAVGSDEEPLRIEAQLEPAAGVDAMTLTLEVPAGQWTFIPDDGAQVQLPNGEVLIDHGSLTGSAGILTGPGLDGLVAGDPSCGRDAVALSDDGELPDDGSDPEASEAEADEPDA